MFRLCVQMWYLLSSCFNFITIDESNIEIFIIGVKIKVFYVLHCVAEHNIISLLFLQSGLFIFHFLTFANSEYFH